MTFSLFIVIQASQYQCHWVDGPNLLSPIPPSVINTNIIAAVVAAHPTYTDLHFLFASQVHADTPLCFPGPY